MAYVSKSEYLAMQAAKNSQSNQNYSNKPRVGYLGLANNNDSAIVRFAYSTPDEIYQDVVTCHSTTINGKFRKVNCLRSMREPIEKCPMCAAGDRYSNRVYIRMIEYTRDENDNIVATPKVFDRPVKYKEILEGLFTEYGDISSYIFKITRMGEKGSKDTQYPIMLCNPTIYNAELYPKDFSAFEGYQVVGGPVLEKSYDEIVELAKNVAPQANNQYYNKSVAETDAQPAVITKGSYYATSDAPRATYEGVPVNTTSYTPSDAFADAPRRTPIYQ